MTRYEFMEKIGFFFADKEGHEWRGRMKKKEQLEAFGFYIGRGLLVINETTMTVKHIVTKCFGAEAEVKDLLTSEGYYPEHGKMVPMSEL